jgi:anti-sigma factor RsiW
MVSDEHDPRHCVAMFEKLSEYIDGELDRLTCRELEKHVENCISCKICLATLKKTINLCRGMAADPLPEGFSEKLKQTLLQNISRRGSMAQKR